MKQVLLALGTLTVVALVAPRSADAGSVVLGIPRVGVTVGAPCAAPFVPVYPPPYYYPYYAPPVVVYAPPYYQRPDYGFPYRDDDYGRRVIGYTFPGRR